MPATRARIISAREGWHRLPLGARGAPVGVPRPDPRAAVDSTGVRYLVDVADTLEEDVEAAARDIRAAAAVDTQSRSGRYGCARLVTHSADVPETTLSDTYVSRAAAGRPDWCAVRPADHHASAASPRPLPSRLPVSYQTAAVQRAETWGSAVGCAPSSSFGQPPSARAGPAVHDDLVQRDLTAQHLDQVPASVRPRPHLTRPLRGQARPRARRPAHCQPCRLSLRPQNHLSTQAGESQRDEWTEGCRYLGLDVLARSRIPSPAPTTALPPPTTRK